MVINFDTSALPTGVRGWHGLLDAIKGASPGDENQWIEFKANVDPATREGAATIAKAIVAFANRDLITAERWLGGHAVIVVGLEPGNVKGIPAIDPADLYNKVNALLAPPAHNWDAMPIDYEGKEVLVFTVDPPRQGDAIATIGKSSGEVEDGHVYVRKLGKSARATSADIRRLSARERATEQSIGGIVVAAADDSEVPVLTYPESWLEDWLYTEERRLLAPLDPSPPTRPLTDAERRAAGLTDRTMADIFKSTEQARKAMASIGGGITHEENRSEDEFREEVRAYLDECRTGLREAFGDLRNTATLEVSLEITNLTDSNYEQVLVELHIEGDVFGYEDEGRFTKISDYLPRAPRKWGPWNEDPLRLIHPDRSYRLASELAADIGPVLPPGPRPTIINGGSVGVTCPPLHLYPRRTSPLLDIWLVGDGPLGEDVRVTWTATASNVNGKLDGGFTIPVSRRQWDLSEQLRHSGGDKR